MCEASEAETKTKKPVLNGNFRKIRPLNSNQNTKLDEI